MDEETKGPKTASIIAFVVLGVAALVAIYFMVAAKPAQVAAPTTFNPFTADDKSFTCVAPGGWQAKSQSAMGTMSKAWFNQGPAKIEILSDLSGSLMADVTRATNAQMEGVAGMVPGASLPKTRPPVESLHQMGRGSVANDFKEYDEGKAIAFQSKAGDSRYSEFTADGGMRVGKVHGYRVTMLGSERSITIVCACPEGSWKTLQPAFQKVINSVTPGQM